MIGYINKIETMGLVDGPGIRIVFFLQGCPLRCLFCHNPETWSFQNSNLKMTSDEIVQKILRYKNYLGEDGGVTFSGGEPLAQADFLLETLKKCKEAGIHTCIDTSGFGTYSEEIFNYIDLVLLDVKALNEDAYKKITGQSYESFYKFLTSCEEKQVKVWIRQVIIPGINDTEEYILKLKEFLKPYQCIEKIELLPYHTMGIKKYEELGLKYRLNSVPAMDLEECKRLEELIRSDNEI